MNSTYEHDDPDYKDLTIQINQTYDNLLSMLLPAMLGIANDHKAIVFMDSDGDEHKTMQDASGDGTIPEGCVVFADADGKASYNSGLLVDITNARIQFPLPFTLAFGDQDTNGSIRIVVTTDGIAFGKRVAGVWDEASLTA